MSFPGPSILSPFLLQWHEYCISLSREQVPTRHSFSLPTGIKTSKWTRCSQLEVNTLPRLRLLRETEIQRCQEGEEEVNGDSNSSEEPVLEQGRQRQWSLAWVSGIWPLQCNHELACFWGVSRAIFWLFFSGHFLDFCLVYKPDPSNFTLCLWATHVSRKIHFLPFLIKICLHFLQPRTLNFFCHVTYNKG